MKVAVLTPSKDRKAETFIQNHINHLPFSKVVIYGGNFPHIAHNYRPTLFERQKFKITQLIRKKIGLKTRDFKSYSLSEILVKEKISVVFAEYLITAAETLNVCRKLNIPIVTIALGYEISMSNVIESYKEKYKELFAYASKILIVSEHMKLTLERLNCPLEKVVFSPAAPHRSFFDIIPNLKNKQLLAVGRFVDKKAPHLTILAFVKVLEEIPDAILVMAGDGKLLNACKDIVSAYKIENSVRFVGKVTVEEHKALLQKSSIFIQHSKRAISGDSEGTPVAILEASAAGLPVVSTNHAGIPRVVISGETGFLVAENDINSMAKKVIFLLNNSRLLKEFSVNGKQYVKNNFSLEKHIDIISNCIKDSTKSKLY